MKKSCPRFEFEITYEYSISYCKNCEGICQNNKAVHGAIDPYLFEKTPLDMLDNFTEDTQIQLMEVMKNISIKRSQKAQTKLEH